MTKAEARQRIRNLKSSILNSTEIFAEALGNNHYKAANNLSIIISGNLKELNKLRTKIKAKKNAIPQNNA